MNFKTAPIILIHAVYVTILASNEIFSPSNKIHREVGRAKDLSAPLYAESIKSINLDGCHPAGVVFRSAVIAMFLKMAKNYL
jgi:hypothetical protein